MRKLLVASAIFLAGCAEQVMDSFVGQDISAVMTQYGPPTASFDMPDGRHAFQWRMTDEVVMPMTTTYNGYGYGNSMSGYATTTGGYMGTQVCHYTLYTKKNGKSWTVIGYEPPRIGCM